jgi:hypothetical protein
MKRLRSSVVSFEVFMAVKIHIVVFWVVIFCTHLSAFIMMSWPRTPLWEAHFRHRQWICFLLCVKFYKNNVIGLHCKIIDLKKKDKTQITQFKSERFLCLITLCNLYISLPRIYLKIDLVIRFSPKFNFVDTFFWGLQYQVLSLLGEISGNVDSDSEGYSLLECDAI